MITGIRRQFVFTVRGSIWLLPAALISIASNSDALAQARPQTAPAQLAQSKLPLVKQIVLTEKQIKGVLAASREINAITDNASEDIDKLSAETTAKLDAVARRNGLASYDEYNTVSENVGLVFGGFDTVTQQYVGKEALIKARIARVRADKKMSADVKKEALQDLADDLQLPLPAVQYKSNIELVIKYYDRLAATMHDGE